MAEKTEAGPPGESSGTFQGRVKFFKEDSRWGFISIGEDDYFVHGSAVSGDIRKGDNVSFTLEESTKPGRRLQAANVRKI